MPLTVRTAVLGDYPEVTVIFRAASLSNVGDRAALLDNPSALELPDPAILNGRARVAVDGDRIVGFASAEPTDDGFELGDLFVHPDRMRQGVGRLLVEDVVERATMAGVTQVWVTGNPHALAFYLELGFREVGTAATEFGDAPRLVLDVPAG